MKELVSKGYGLWRRTGLIGILRWFKTAKTYPNWVKKFDTLTDYDRMAISKKITNLQLQPLISVLMPAYNTPEQWLRRAIDSVREQLYPNWELCIADDASTEPHVRKVLEEYSRLDERIHVRFRDKNGHISAASNTTLQMANGEYVALLDHDDELRSHALYMVIDAINKNPKLDLIYSDEDKIDTTGRRCAYHFKPDWNPDLLTAQNIICHLGVYRTKIVRQVGGFREGYEGAQDWDLALRVSDAIPASHIHHIPHVLYHWRTLAGSTSVSVSEKSYALKTALAAVQDHLSRTGTPAQVEPIAGRYIRVLYTINDPAPLVSIIIPTRNGVRLLRQCIDSLTKKTTYPKFEIIVIDNQSDDPDAKQYLASLRAKNIANVVTYDKPFNFSAINNFAVQYAKGEVLCLMNNDIEVITDNWLEEMVSHALRSEIGVVGAMLYYPNDTIQHAGVLVGMGGVAGHFYSRCPRGESGYMERARVVQNLSAVTAACLVVQKNIYIETGGMDEVNLTVAFNDIDFCLRVLELGYRNLWTPFAELYHHESATRGPEVTPEKQRRFQREISYMRSRWPHMLENDPAYNPNLTLDQSWPTLATVPRTPKPWLQ
jgi:glycosyltransferase involved in cell wall biosynthesis